MAIIAVLLILGSVAMFIFPWFGLYVTIEDETVSLNGFLEKQAAEEQISLDQVKDQPLKALEALFDEWYYEFGVQRDKEPVVSFAETLLKGAWSPVDLLTLTGSVRSVANDLGGGLESLAAQYPGQDTSMIEEYQEIEKTINIVYSVYLGLLSLCALLALIAVICVLTDHRGGIIPYMILVILLLGAVIAGTVLVNQNMEVLKNIEELLYEIGIDVRDLPITLKPALFGILSAGLAVLAFVVTFIPLGRRSGKNEKPAASAGGDGWMCPTCGALRGAEQKFCLNCGTPRPNSAGGPARAPMGAAASGNWTCPNCGTRLKADQRFCLNCGTRRQEAGYAPSYPQQRTAYPGSAPSPARIMPGPAPSPVRSAGGWTCPRCSLLLDERQQFCPRCGTSKPVNRPAPSRAPAPAPAPTPTPASRRAPAGGWTCPRCGASLQDTQKFCPRCGSGQPEAAPAPAPAPKRAPAGWTCPSCGASLQDGQKFCPRCGGRRPEAAPAPTPAPTSAPAPRRAPAGWTCPSCGAKLEDSQKFCPRCGGKRPETAPAPTPAGWTCSVCGAVLKDEQKFCPRCGSKRPEAAPAPAPAPKEEAAPAPAPRLCAGCGYTLQEGMDFCPKCGKRYTEPAPAPIGKHARPEEEFPEPAVPEDDDFLDKYPFPDPEPTKDDEPNEEPEEPGFSMPDLTDIDVPTAKPEDLSEDTFDPTAGLHFDDPFDADDSAAPDEADEPAEDPSPLDYKPEGEDIL